MQPTRKQDEEAGRMLDMYGAILEEFMALPVVKGLKTDQREICRGALYLLH